MPDANFNSPAYSITHEQRPSCFPWSRRNQWLVLTFVPILVLYQSAAMAAYPQIRFSAESVEHENFSLHEVEAQLDIEGGFRLDSGRILVDGVEREISDFSLQGLIEEASNRAGVELFRCNVRIGIFEAEVELTRQKGLISAGLKLARQEIDSFRKLQGMPAQINWLSRGHVDAELKFRQLPDSEPDIKVQLGIGDVGFDSPDGRFAAEALHLEMELSVLARDWSSPVIKGVISSGELLIDDFYRNFADGEMEFALRPEWQDAGVVIHSARLSDKQSLTVEGRGALGSKEDPDSWAVEISRLEMEFPVAYERYMEPVAAAWTLDGLTVTGRVGWSGQWSGGEFSSGDLTITDLSIVDTQRKRFAVTGLDARMRPGDHAFNSKLDWRGLLLGRINLGSGEVALDSEPGKFAITQPLALDVLGGQLHLHELSVLLPGGSGSDAGEPDIRLRADLEELEMEQLTEAFGWPLFSGKISGQIPGVSLEDGVLDLEGEILVNVFDGSLTLDDFRIERPFGVLPSLAANVEVENLDLELLTSTFSFGQISGRLDGYVRDLRMLDWRPVAFVAWLGTPGSQRGSQDISRQAVNTLTTLGGGGATAALTSPLMRLFNSFSYKRLGLGCRMQNNVCEVRGVSEDDVSVLIMEGAGIPKVTIRVFNRSVDWPQLLAHLVAASEGEDIRIGD
jgi:hypothetical protein